MKIYYDKENIDKESFLFEKINENLKEFDENQNENNKIYLLVPEQYSLEGEKDFFYFFKDIKATINFEVLTITNFLNKFNKFFNKNNLPLINSVNKTALIFNSILKNDLKTISKVKKVAALDNIERVIDDLKNSGTTLEDLEKIISKKEGRRKEKLSDIYIIYKDYLSKTKGKYLDKNDLIINITKQINELKEDYGFFKNSYYYLYGFEHLSNIDVDLVLSISKKCKELSAFFTTDYNKDNFFFLAANSVIERIEKQGKTCSEEVSVLKISENGGKEKECKEDFLVLQKEFPKFEQGKRYDLKEQNTHIYKCNNFSEELVSIASRIKEIIYLNKYRYKDIKVIVENLKEKQEAIEKYFNLYEIPFFVDSKKDIKENEISIFILSFLILLMDKNNELSFKRIINMKKILPISISKLTKTFIKDNDVKLEKLLEIANDFNLEKVSNYLKKKTNLKEEKPKAIKENAEEIKEGITKLSALLSETISFVNLGESFSEKIGNLLNILEEKYTLAEEEDVFTEVKAKLLESFEMLKDCELTFKEGIEIVNKVLLEIKKGMLPAGKDKVFIGETSKSRFSKAKVVFFINFGEDSTLNNTFTGFFSEDDLRSLNEDELLIRLPVHKNSEHLILLYKLLSKSEQEIYITYSIKNDKGEDCKYSFLLEKINSIFDIKQKDGFFLDKFNAVKNRNTAILFLSFFVGESKERFAENNDQLQQIKTIYDVLNNSGKVYKLKDTFTFGGEAIQKSEIKSKLVNGEISVTNFEKYSRCPYSFFISSILNVNEKYEKNVGFKEIGNMYHFILSKLDTDKVNEFKDSDYDDKEINTFIENELNVFKSKGGGTNYFKTNNIDTVYEEFLKRNLKESIFTLLDIYDDFILRGDELKILNEIKLGTKTNDIELPNPSIGGITFKGIIDSLVIIDSNAQKEVFIRDFKSGQNMENTKSDIEALYSLQTLIYLYAVKNGLFENTNAVIKDGKFFRILDFKEMIKEPKYLNTNKYRTLKERKEFTEGIGKNFLEKNNVLVEKLNDEHFKKIEKKVAMLSSGDIKVKPIKKTDKDACAFCAYKGICKYYDYEEEIVEEDEG